jgi:hypothetical protein
MDTLRKALILLLVFGIPAAAPPFFAKSPELCFTSGTATYRLAPDAITADYTVAIDNSAEFPDLRIRLVDQVASADFAITDDAGMLPGDPCRGAGALKTVRLVPRGARADITIGVTHASLDADLTLYVHSARLDHFQAAALLALIRHVDADSAAALRGPPSTLAAYN